MPKWDPNPRTLNDLIRFLIAMDAKLDEILETCTATTMKSPEHDTKELRRRLEAYLERSEARLEAEELRAARRRARPRRLTLGLLGR